MNYVKPAQGELSANLTSSEHMSAKYFWHPLADTRTGLAIQNSLG